MSPVPAGYDWALPTVGTRRHVKVGGQSLCASWLTLSLEQDTERVMAHPACKRCLQRTGGVE